MRIKANKQINFISDSLVDSKCQNSSSSPLLAVKFFEKKSKETQLTRCFNLSNSITTKLNKFIYIKITANQACSINFTIKNSKNSLFSLKSVESKKKFTKAADYLMSEVVTLEKGDKKFFALAPRKKASGTSIREETTFEIYAYSSEDSKISNLFKFKIYPANSTQNSNNGMFNPFQKVSGEIGIAEPYSLTADEDDSTTDEEIECDIQSKKVQEAEQRAARILANLSQTYRK